jgi:hypothetical protein
MGRVMMLWAVKRVFLFQLDLGGQRGDQRAGVA